MPLIIAETNSLNAWSFATSLAWPLLVLALAVIFRDELRALIGRLHEAEFFGQKIVAANVLEKKFSSPVDVAVRPFLGHSGLFVPEGFKMKTDPRGVYFFSHDLMLSYAALLTRSTKETMIQTLASAERHLVDLGFKDTPVFQKFHAVFQAVESATPTRLDDNERAGLAHELWQISRFVGSITENPQLLAQNLAAK